MLKELLNRIKCKLFICCKSKCSLNESQEIVLEQKHYDYYTNKEKKLSTPFATTQGQNL